MQTWLSVATFALSLLSRQEVVADAQAAETMNGTRLVLQSQSGPATSSTRNIAISSNGKWLVTSGDDKLAYMWDVGSGRLVRVFRDHSDLITSIAVSNDSKWLITGSKDRTARLWRLDSGGLVQVFRGHEGPVTSVAISKDGLHLFTASGRLDFDDDSGESKDFTARMWEVASGKQIRVFAGHKDGITSVSLSFDGRRLATGSLDQTARLWETTTGKEVFILTGHTAPISLVDASTDGKWLLTAVCTDYSWLFRRRGLRDDHGIRLWNLETGKQVRSFWTSHRSHIYSASVSRDSKAVLTCQTYGMESTAIVAELSTGAIRHEFRAFGHGPAAMYEDKWLVMAGNDNVSFRLWDLATNNEKLVIKGESCRLTHTSISRNGKELALAGLNTSPIARWWDLCQGRQVRVLRGHDESRKHLVATGSLAFAPAGLDLFTGGNDSTVRLWDSRKDNEVWSFKGEPITYSVAVSPDGKQFLTGGIDGTARLWDAKGKEIVRFAENDGAVNHVAFSHDGKLILTVANGFVQIYQACTGKRKCSFRVSGVMSIEFSPDARYVLTAGYYHRNNSANRITGIVQIWDADTGEEVRGFECESGLSFARFSPSGRQILTGGFDFAARLWDTFTCREIRRFDGHLGTVSAGVFTADGTEVITTSEDGTARLWATNTEKEICRIIGFNDGTWAVIDADGRYDSSNDGEIKWLHWVAGTEIVALSQLRNRFYHPGLLAKHMGFDPKPLPNVKTFQHVTLYPEVEVEQPKTGDTKLNLRLKNRGGGIGKIQVFVNANERIADARGPKFDKSLANAALDIDLAGTLVASQTNRIRIVAWNVEEYLSSSGIEFELVVK